MNTVTHITVTDVIFIQLAAGICGGGGHGRSRGRISNSHSSSSKHLQFCMLTEQRVNCEILRY